MRNIWYLKFIIHARRFRILKVIQIVMDVAGHIVIICNILKVKHEQLSKLIIITFISMIPNICREK